jgi:hypothetical protein
MASQSAKKILGIDKSNAKKPRGRTAATTKAINPAPTHRISPNELRTQANRPVGSGGGGLHRGDRRDMHPLFSTGKDKVKGGKRGPIGRSTRKGGVND